MNKIMVVGGKRLFGEVKIGGSKNAALPVLFAGILTGESCVFENLPRIGDVLLALEILRDLGARIRFLHGGDVVVDYSTVRPVLPPRQLTEAIRGSVYLLGSMLGRFGKAMLAGAGGCDFGSRPIDQHLRGFGLLGAREEREADVLHLFLPQGECLRGTRIALAMPSVGASANLLMAASVAVGMTVIENAAMEPHVLSLVAFLREAGARIDMGRGRRISVLGKERLHGCRFRVIPDMIEAGTYLFAGMATGGEVRLLEVDPSHLGAVLEVLREMGAEIRVGNEDILLKAPERYRNVSVRTGPYPAFPTDLHPQLAALFCIGGRAKGRGEIRETVWQQRFRYTEELVRMGARVGIEEDRATFLPAMLSGTAVRSPDLRGGAALLLAALAASGRSEITNAATVGRGYEHLEQKLRGLGAEVRIFG